MTDRYNIMCYIDVHDKHQPSYVDDGSSSGDNLLSFNSTTEELVFHPEAPVLKYHQNSSNSCCLSSLASAFHSIGEYRAATALENRIEYSLTLQTDIFRNKIDFANDILKTQIASRNMNSA